MNEKEKLKSLKASIDVVSKYDTLDQLEADIISKLDDKNAEKTFHELEHIEFKRKVKTLKKEKKRN